VFFAAITWLMPSGSLACVIDQLIETFEFIFSPAPLEKYYLLSNPVADAIAFKLIVTFLFTAIPNYTICYPLFLRHFNSNNV